MSKLRITINPEGFNTARKDPRIVADLHARGERIAAAAGGAPDFEVVDYVSGQRARTIVRTATAKAAAAEATDRVLTRAFDAAVG